MSECKPGCDCQEVKKAEMEKEAAAWRGQPYRVPKFRGESIEQMMMRIQNNSKAQP